MKNLDIILKEIIEYGKYSFDLEKKREESLIQQAGHMLSAFAFSTAALYILMPIFLNDLSFLYDRFIIFWVSIISLFLIISLLFAIIAMWRWKYCGMPSIDQLYKKIKKDVDSYRKDDVAILTDWKNTISSMHKSIETLNNRRGIFIKLSMWSFITSIILVFGAVLNAALII